MFEDKNRENNPTIYEIKLQGHLDAQWSAWFYGMTITREQDGSTILCGPLPDQTVLHSVLSRIRDMNLKLVSVRQIVSGGQSIHSEAKGENHEESPIYITKNQTDSQGEIRNEKQSESKNKFDEEKENE